LYSIAPEHSDIITVCLNDNHEIEDVKKESEGHYNDNDDFQTSNDNIIENNENDGEETLGN